MPAKPVSILIVEDEMIIGANISMQLTNLGYEVAGLLPGGEEAISFIRDNPADLLLMDIHLKGALDGIETVRKIQSFCDIPVIYLTANTDEAHFSRAKDTKPEAFISKPFKKLDLQRAVELTLSRTKGDKPKPDNETSTDEADGVPFILSDSIFVKDHEKMVKIVISNIWYVEAERNYCRIYSRQKEYLLVMTLKDLNQKLPTEHFVRIHRSFIINLTHIDEVGSNYVVVAGKAIPLSKSYKEGLLKRLRTI